jgi:AcrR family transcriptional regulator
VTQLRDPEKLALAKRPLRRDAAQHRVQLLAAAAQLFADGGLGVSVDEIARVAGVGMGTLYRRFPTKEALVQELVRAQLVELIEAGTAAKGMAGGLGLETFLWQAGELMAAHDGCLSRLRTEANSPGLGKHLRGLMGELLVDGQRHGRIRSDAVASDISLVIWSLVGVIETARAAAPQAWRRALELLLSGLRPARAALTEPAPTPRKMRKVIEQRS